MGIQEIRDPAAIRAAMDEYDRVGRTYFLEKYGFGKARDYMLRDPETGRLYDSKVIVGATYGYAFPEGASLSSTDFVGGGSRRTPAHHPGFRSHADRPGLEPRRS